MNRLSQMRHSATLPRRSAIVVSRSSTVPWAGVYCSAVLAVWVLSPFLRRVMDFKTHYSAISPFAVLPMLMLVPAVAMFFAGRARPLNKALEFVALMWLLGFSYALVVAILAGHIFGGIFTFVSFCLPLGFTLWVATRPEDAEFWYRRISSTLIVLAVIAGVYGIIQYTVLPAWDASWMNNVRMASNGLAQPFSVRVFSMLNSPGTFAIFLTLSTIMFLPRLTLKTGLLLVPIFIGLGLSMVRAGWVTLPLAIVVFAFLTPRRKQLLTGVAAFIGIGVLAVVFSPILLGGDISGTFQGRLSSLSDVGNDASAQNRAGQVSEAFGMGMADPEGAGLGAAGIGSRLNSAEESAGNIDSGYLSRFVEMGIPGTLAFLASLGIALGAAIRAWRIAVRGSDAAAQDRAALAITMQLTLIVLNLFGDVDNSAVATIAWLSLALVLRNPVAKTSVR